MKQMIFLLGLVSSLSQFSAMAQNVDRNNNIGIAFNYDDYGKAEWWSESKNLTTYGFSVQYTHDFRLLKNLPIYLRTGIDANFNFASNKHYGFSDADKFNNINFSIPVDLTYKFGLGKCFISPIAGIALRLNAYGKYKESETWGAEASDANFSVYGSDNDGVRNWHRFQVLWNVGLNFEYNNYYVTATYGRDFGVSHKYFPTYVGIANPMETPLPPSKTKVAENVRMQSIKVGIGLKF